jgi:hypothetical protein
MNVTLTLICYKNGDFTAKMVIFQQKKSNFAAKTGSSANISNCVYAKNMLYLAATLLMVSAAVMAQ